MHISVVTPAYKCEKCIKALYERLVKSLENITDDFEIIFVNDASPQEDWNEISDLAEKDKRVKGINLLRNLGQHYAITAGLDFADGDWVVVMDCDLQDQPEEIPKLYAKAQEGYEVVVGRRYNRKDNLLRKATAKMFRVVYEYFTETKMDYSLANFTIMSKEVVNNIRKMREQNRSHLLFIEWIGHEITSIDIEHAGRYEGKSSYNIRKLFRLAFDNIVAHSNKPLRISIELGSAVSMLAVIYTVFMIIRYFYTGVIAAGWTSVMVSIWFFSGLILASMGVLGLYLGKVFDEVKGRPLYVVKELLNIEKIQ